jgi:hypothetical protein
MVVNGCYRFAETSRFVHPFPTSERIALIQACVSHDFESANLSRVAEGEFTRVAVVSPVGSAASVSLTRCKFPRNGNYSNTRSALAGRWLILNFPYRNDRRDRRHQAPRPSRLRPMPEPTREVHKDAVS